MQHSESLAFDFEFAAWRGICKHFSLKHFSVVALALVAFGIGLDQRVEAANAVYSLVSYPTLQNGYTLTGTMTTNGHLGVLAYSDILDTSFVVSNGATTYQTVHASEVYGLTNLLATSTELRLPVSTNVNSAPQLKIGGTGFDTPQLQFDYLKFADGSIALYSDCVVDHPKTLTIVWNTTSGADLLQLNGDPWLVATRVPEPSTLITTGIGAVCLLAIRRLRGRKGIRHLQT